jgi:hypothetical protein
MLLGERQRPLGKGVRFLQVAGTQMRLPQRETTVHLIAAHFRFRHPFQRLHEHRHGVGGAPGQGVRRPQNRSYPWEPERDVHILTEAHGPFELAEGPRQVALAEE